jgi:antitoxin component of RelBE/YafQ-DinJ toxin-antitoxin module
VNERIPCEFFLVRYVPDPVKNEFVNIGVLLREAGRPEGTVVRFTRSWSRVRCIDPDADVATLEALEIEVRRRLLEEAQPVLKTIGDSFSQLVQLTPAKACLAESIPAELDLLMQLHVESPKRESTVRQSGRMTIHARMRSEFERAGVWDLLRKRISAAPYTQKGDPLRIDCGYRANGDLRMFHAVSLATDAETATVLAFSAGKLRAGVKQHEGAELELTAISEPIDSVGDDEARRAQYEFGRDVMRDSGIRFMVTKELERIAATARRELRV